MSIETEAFSKTKNLKSEIENSHLKTSAISKKQFNYEFTITSGIDSLKVQVYFGKKGVKTILQGNKDSDLYKKINNLVFGETFFEKPKGIIDEPDNYIGTDESGKGDFFGPLTVAAFYSNEKIKHELIALGVKDSKLLTDSQINFIADKIKSIKNVFYEVVVVTPSKYNELYAKFGNLNLLLNWAHSKAIEVLLEKVETNTIITDKFSKRELNITVKHNHNSTAENKINFIQTEKGERFIGVAAASILARNAMNLWFEKHKINSLILPKGASGEVDAKAQKIKNEFGEVKLKEIAKLHFKTLQKIK